VKYFPVRGRCHFVDTWGAPRSGGRAHKGVDIYADEGTPAVAVETGWATASEGGLGGLGVNVITSDGTRFYYGHLSGWHGTFPRRVQAGERLGGVGSTGNAAGGPPHLHFQVHPQGGEAVNPVPLIETLPQVNSTDFLSWAPGKKTKKKTTRETDVGGGVAILFILWALMSRRKNHG